MKVKREHPGARVISRPSNMMLSTLSVHVSKLLVWALATLMVLELLYCATAEVP